MSSLSSSSPLREESLSHDDPHLLSTCANNGAKHNSCKSEDLAQRLRVVGELIESERHYITDLSTFLRRVHRPLSHQPAYGALAEQAFSALLPVVEFSKDFYKNLCSVVHNVEPFSQLFGQVLLQSAEPMTEVYAQFCERQAGAVAALERLKQHKDGAEALASATNELRDLYKRKGAGRLAEANAVLVLPVQRITRYPLLTSSLLRATPPSHPDHDLLTHALVSLMASTEKANEARRRRDIVLKYVQAPGSISLAGISLAPLSNMSAKLGAHIYRMTGLAGEPGDNVHAEIDALSVRREAVRSLLRKVFKLRQCIRKSVRQSVTATEHFVHSMKSQGPSERGMGGEVAKRSCEVMQKVESVVLPALERRLQEQLEDPLAHLLRLGAGPLRLARALTAKRAEANTVSGETRDAPRAAAECLGASLSAELPQFIQTADRLMDAAVRALGAALMLFSQDVAFEMSALHGGESAGVRVSLQPSSISNSFSFMKKGGKEDLMKTTCIVKNGDLENEQAKKEGYPYLQDNLQNEMSLLLQRVMSKGEKIEDEEDYTWKEAEDVVGNATAEFQGEFVEKNNENREIHCIQEENGTLIVMETPVKRHGETKDDEKEVKGGQEILEMDCETEKANSIIIEKGELPVDNTSGTLSCVEMSGAENCEVALNVLSPNSAHDFPPPPPPPDLLLPCTSPTFPPPPPPVFFPYWLPPLASTSEHCTDNHLSINLKGLDLHAVSQSYQDPSTHLFSESLEKKSGHARYLDVQSTVPFNDHKRSHNVHKALRTCRNDSGYSSLQPARRAKRITGEHVYLLEKDYHLDPQKDTKGRGDVQEDSENMSDKNNGTEATVGKIMQMNNGEKRDLIKIENVKLMVKLQSDETSEINLRDEMERGIQGNEIGKDNLQVRLMEPQKKETKCHSREDENVIGQQQKEDYLRQDDAILNTPILDLVRQDKNKIMQGCEHGNTADVKDVKREIGKNLTKETHKEGLDIRGQRKPSTESNRGHLQEMDRGLQQDKYRHSDNRHKWMFDMKRNCKQEPDTDRSRGQEPDTERSRGLELNTDRICGWEPGKDGGRDREPGGDRGQDGEPGGVMDREREPVREWGRDRELTGGCGQEPTLDVYSSSGASLAHGRCTLSTDGCSNPTLNRAGGRKPTERAGGREPTLERAGGREPTLERAGGREPTLERAGGREPTLERAGGREPMLERAGGREPTLERAGGREPTLERAGGCEPTLERAGGREPTLERAGGREPTLERAGGREPTLERAGGREPMLERAGGREPTLERAGGREPTLERAGGREPTLERAGGREPTLERAGGREPTLDRAGGREPTLDRAGGREPTLDRAGGREPTLDRAGGREPTLDRAGGREPTLDRVGGREPTLDRAGGREPTLDRAGGREPTLDRAGGREPTLDRAGGREPTLDRAGGREPTLDRAGGREPTLDRAGGREPTLDRVGSREPTLDRAGGCEPRDRAERTLDRTRIRDPDRDRARARHMSHQRDPHRDRHVPREQDPHRDRHVPWERDQHGDMYENVPQERNPHRKMPQNLDRDRYVPREWRPERHLDRDRLHEWDPDRDRLNDPHSVHIQTATFRVDEEKTFYANTERVKKSERCKYLPKEFGERSKSCERNLQEDRRFSAPCNNGEVFEISKQKGSKLHEHISTKREAGIMSEAGTLRSLRSRGREKNFVDNRALKCSTLPRNLGLDEDKKARERHRRRARDIFQESHVKSAASPQSVSSTNSSISLSFDSVDPGPLYRACFEFKASRSNEISLMPGQKVMVIRSGDASGNPAWWLVEQAQDCQGTNSRKVKRGYVPASYLQPMVS